VAELGLELRSSRINTPEDALLRFEAWKAGHKEALASVPADAVQIQTGRAPLQAHVRARPVAEPYAAGFTSGFASPS
jgi:hypothetical protein